MISFLVMVLTRIQFYDYPISDKINSHKQGGNVYEKFLCWNKEYFYGCSGAHFSYPN
jgi:hypothetical protein